MLVDDLYDFQGARVNAARTFYLRAADAFVALGFLVSGF